MLITNGPISDRHRELCIEKAFELFEAETILTLLQSGPCSPEGYSTALLMACKKRSMGDVCGHLLSSKIFPLDLLCRAYRDAAKHGCISQKDMLLAKIAQMPLSHQECDEMFIQASKQRGCQEMIGHFYP